MCNCRKDDKKPEPPKPASGAGLGWLLAGILGVVALASASSKKAGK